MNSRTAVGPTAALKDRTHGFEEIPVLPPTRTHRPTPPRVEPRSRNGKQSAQARHAEPLPLFFDEGEDVGFRAEVNRMSFFSNACSSWSSAWARCSDCNRLMSRTGGTFTALGTETPRATRHRGLLSAIATA